MRGWPSPSHRASSKSVGAACKNPVQFALPESQRGAWFLHRTPASAVKNPAHPRLHDACTSLCSTRCRPLASRFRDWWSLDRTLPTSDVSCRTARTVVPAPAGGQLITHGTRTIAGPRRLPSYRTILLLPSCPGPNRPKLRALTFDRLSAKSRAPVRRLYHRLARQFSRDDFRPAMRPAFTVRQRCVPTDFCFPSLPNSSTRVPWLPGSFLADGARGIWRFTAPKPLRRMTELRARALSSRACPTIEPLTSPQRAFQPVSTASPPVPVKPR